jgi:hypothetical protein
MTLGPPSGESARTRARTVVSSGSLPHGNPRIQGGAFDQDALAQVVEATLLRDIVRGKLGNLRDFSIDGELGFTKTGQEPGLAGEQIATDSIVAVADPKLKRLGVGEDLERVGAPSLCIEEAMQRSHREIGVQQHDDHRAGHGDAIPTTLLHTGSSV